MRRKQTASKHKPPIISVNLVQVPPIVLETTFVLYEGGNLISTKRFWELCARIGREAGLQLLFEGEEEKKDRKISEIYLRSRDKITREVLHKKLETVGRIIKELYELPQAILQIQQGLF